MKNRKSKAFISIIWLNFFLATVCFSQQNLTVRGKVVDETGKSIPKALVAMTDYAPPKGAIDWLILGDTTDEKGDFEISTYTNAKEIHTYLFASAYNSTKNALAPIYAPFNILHNQNPASKGTPITLKENNDLNIGEIKIQVWLCLVELSNRSQIV